LFDILRAAAEHRVAWSRPARPAGQTTVILKPGALPPFVKMPVE
jgi:hypothetical protein